MDTAEIIIYSLIAALIAGRITIEYLHYRSDMIYKRKKHKRDADHAAEQIINLEQLIETARETGLEDVERQTHLLIGKIEEDPGYASTEAFFVNYVSIMMMMIENAFRIAVNSGTGLNNFSKN